MLVHFVLTASCRQRVFLTQINPGREVEGLVPISFWAAGLQSEAVEAGRNISSGKFLTFFTRHAARQFLTAKVVHVTQDVLFRIVRDDAFNGLGGDRKIRVVRGQPQLLECRLVIPVCDENL